MLYLPIKKGWGKGSMELQLIDEAQDFSRLQHKAVEHYAGKSGRIIYVGDPDQAIYVFSGGDKEGLSRAEEKLGALRMPLSVTFRCPKSHVQVAQQFSDNIEAHPEAIDGEVKHLDLEELPGLALDGDLIMARTNQDIIRAALKLTQQGRTTQILGTSLTELLERDIKAALPFPFLHGDIEGRLMSHWRSGLEELYQRGLDRNGMKKRSEELADRLGVIGTLAAVCVQHKQGERAEWQDILDLLASLEGENGVKLCTIHKAKGLEADRAFVIGADKIMDAQGDEDRAVAFVAMTRGKQFLGLVGVPELSPLEDGDDLGERPAV